MPDTSVQAGKRLVWSVAIIAVTVSAATILTLNIVGGSDRLPQQIVRFGLTLALCFFLLRGKRWARWIAAVLFSFAGFGALELWLAFFGTSSKGWGFFVMAIAYIYCSVVLTASASVRVFFNRHRDAARVREPNEVV